MAIDDSFTKPGSIPFKWEIRPGVPKVQEHEDQQQHSPRYNHHYSSVQEEQQQKQKEKLSDRCHSFPSTPQKLRPPPGGLYFPSPPEIRNRSSRSTPRTRSQSLRHDRPVLSHPKIVSSGCFINPLLRRKDEKKRTNKLKLESHYASELETLSRWSVSSGKSPSPFRDSLSSSSLSSYRSSPRPVSDAEWAGFALF